MPNLEIWQRLSDLSKQYNKETNGNSVYGGEHSKPFRKWLRRKGYILRLDNNNSIIDFTPPDNEKISKNKKNNIIIIKLIRGFFRDIKEHIEKWIEKGK